MSEAEDILYLYLFKAATLFFIITASVGTSSLKAAMQDGGGWVSVRVRTHTTPILFRPLDSSPPPGVQRVPALVSENESTKQIPTSDATVHRGTPSA